MKQNPMFEFDREILEKSNTALRATSKQREKIREVAFLNQKKVLEAFICEGVGEYHLTGTTGYGFSDSGRQTLDRVYARIFNCHSAIVRHQIVSGTHALAAALFGNLRPGQRLICATGDPYDTIKPVLGLDKSFRGGLNEWNVKVDIIPLDHRQMPNLKAITDSIDGGTRMVYLQRSCGYTWRPSFPVDLLGRIVSAVKEKKPDTIIMVDNCYGEMVEKTEPTDVGADIIGGSLIKNMGGGIAPTGGYIAGTQETVEGASNYLTCAGIGRDEGATLNLGRLLYQGTFFAPHIIAGALEGVIWASHLLRNLGFDTMPGPDDYRTDIIQGIMLGSVEKQKVFCKGIQSACPVDSMANPLPGSLPGYSDPIIMAGGTFIQGSSIELSCDGPEREPYAVYLQGGISFEHIRLGVLNALSEMKRNKMV